MSLDKKIKMQAALSKSFVQFNREIVTFTNFKLSNDAILSTEVFAKLNIYVEIL